MVIPAQHPRFHLRRFFRAQADAEGVGYQTLINALLRKAAVGTGKAKTEAKPLTVATLRRVLREELHTS